MGYEVAEQFGLGAARRHFLSDGGGVGMIGMWKAFDEMEALGWIGNEAPQNDRRAGGRLPARRARVRAGKSHSQFWENAYDRAPSGLRVPEAMGDFLVLKAVRESAERRSR